jgi:glycerol-3-phosphate acyltransferase PlsX
LITSDKSNNFVGYVEGNDIFGNKTDVIVTDGFTGNITLKTAEGLYNMMQNKISDGSKSSVLLSLIKYFYKRKIGFMQPDKFNGACLLGTKGVVVKSHGGANKQAFVAAIKQAKDQIEVDLPKLISDGI